MQANWDFPAKAAPRIAKQVGAAFGPDSNDAVFKDGDRIAATCAAGLIATSPGAKLGKGFLALALISAKKPWFGPLMIPPALRHLFRASANAATE